MIFVHFSDGFSGASDETLPLLDSKPHKSLKSLHFFVLCFAATSYLGIAAVMVELPLIIGTSPEGLSLATWCTLAVQVANLFAVAYFTLNKYVDLRDSPVNILCLVGGLAGSWAMANHYNLVTPLWNTPTSAVVIGSVFIFGIIGTMSSLSSLPYVGRFSEIYMKTYMVGEGLSLLLPGAIALVQGLCGTADCKSAHHNQTTSVDLTTAAAPARFSIETYFYVVFALFFLGMISFMLLSGLPNYRTEIAAVKIGNCNYYQYSCEHNFDSGILNSEGIYLLALLTVMFVLSNGILPSVQPFSSVPYGNYVFHLIAALSTFTSPLTYLISYYVKIYSTKSISRLAVVVLLLDAYAIGVAVVQKPPFLGTHLGKMLIVSIILNI